MKKVTRKLIFFVLFLIAAGLIGYREYNDPFNRIRRTGVMKVGMTGDYLPVSYLNEDTGHMGGPGHSPMGGPRF